MDTYVQKVIKDVDISEVVHGIDELNRWGQFAAQAGLIPQGTSIPQAMAIIQCGKEIGLQPLQSLRSMNFIKGRLTMSVQLQLALAKQRGVKIIEMIEEENLCRITLDRSGETITCSYSLEDAKKAGLIKQDGNYEKYLKQMLRWRATGDCLRMIAPDLVMGLLSPEEAELIEPFAPAIAPVVKNPNLITAQAQQHKQELSNAIEGNKIITSISKITSKPGIGKDKKDKDGNVIPGKPYTIYTIYGDGDVKYSTFDKDIARGAKTAKENGVKVCIVTKGDKYNSIVSLDLVEPDYSDPAASQNPESADLLAEQEDIEEKDIHY